MMQTACDIPIGGLSGKAPLDLEFSPFITSGTGSESRRFNWGFALLTLATAMLFLRPADLLQDLQDLPIYELLIIGCLLVSLPRITAELSRRVLLATPISACVLGLLAAVVLSHLSHLHIYEARLDGWEFSKICVFYLLLLAWVDSPEQLRRFITFLACSILILTTVALLTYHGTIALEPLAALRQADVSAESGTVVRLCGVGVFHDPNDLCLMLLIAIAASAYCLNDRRHGAIRLVWLLALGIFSYALMLTYSRGGFIAVIVGALVFLLARYGRRNAIALALLLVPVAVFIAGGRQTYVDVSDPTDTFQTRLQLWSDALDLFRADPLFGIGQGNMAERTGQVAHNSFLQSYTELGLLGGTALLGAFYLAMTGMSRAAPKMDPELQRARPYLLGIVAGYAVGIFSLSRAYIVPTYLVLGLAAAHLRLASATMPTAKLDHRMLLRLALVSMAFLLAMYLFVQLFVRWN